MSTIPRTLKNAWRSGIKSYIYQMATIGDTKAGTLVGVDRYGNKFFQNDEEELPLRTRWVEYKNFYGDAGDIQPGWHAWISHATDQIPDETAPVNAGYHKWGAATRANLTQSPGAYKPYSTVRPKISSWEPIVAARK